jgi:hypothetical protein
LKEQEILEKLRTYLTRFAYARPSRGTVPDHRPHYYRWTYANHDPFTEMGRVAKNPLLTIKELWHIRGAGGIAGRREGKVVGTSEITRR